MVLVQLVAKVLEHRSVGIAHRCLAPGLVHYGLILLVTLVVALNAAHGILSLRLRNDHFRHDGSDEEIDSNNRTNAFVRIATIRCKDR